MVSENKNNCIYCITSNISTSIKTSVEENMPKIATSIVGALFMRLPQVNFSAL